MASSSLSSWVPVAAGSDFPIQNLPYGVFTSPNNPKERHIGVAIGDQVVDLHALASVGLFNDVSSLHQGAVFLHPTLNSFMSLNRSAWSEARQLLMSLLSSSNSTIRDNSQLRDRCLIPQSSIQSHLPAIIGDYTDFYSSKNHAYNVGVMFRGTANALQPNYLHLPVGYHGRSSSVVVSGTDLHRPYGQITPDDSTPPTLGTCKLLDFELEVGVFVGGQGNKLGHPINLSESEDFLFGVVLLNDWSARDIQRWEYVPLGPFTAKNFGTSISPWIVTFEALEPFRIPHQSQSPTPLPYLITPDSAVTAYDIQLNVTLQSPDMPQPALISQSNTRHLYWTFSQQLVHHTITGCNMRAGDLLGSGTISGTEPAEYGSMLELSWKGTKTVKLAGSEQDRRFLQDGDEVCFTGKATKPGLNHHIGFGQCKGRILPPITLKV